MKSTFPLLLLILCFSSCKKETTSIENFDFVIAFGSCNNQDIENKLWQEVDKHNPNVWIWGGDIVYGDTEDMEVLEEKYTKLKHDMVYAEFTKNKDILGTWDDHDYGVNDGGNEYEQKDASQQKFLDFFDVPQDSERRSRKGIYHAQNYIINGKNLKIILLDTRYFRTELTKNLDNDDPNKPYKRYIPNNHADGTLLGIEQWNWLEDELTNSNADYTLLVSSIQFLSAEHGWETWGNMPNEVQKLEQLLVQTKTKNAIILSGDRHISDFSMKTVEGLNYPLVDFTSSGMTHSSTNNLGEPNKYRVGNLVNELSFGVLKFNFAENTVLMEMRGVNNILQQTHKQNY